MENVIKNYEPIKLPNNFKKVEVKNNDTVDIGFSDIHLGKK